MNKYINSVLVLLFTTFSAAAYDFIVDGVCYDMLEVNNIKSARVVAPWWIDPGIHEVGLSSLFVESEYKDKTYKGANYIVPRRVTNPETGEILEVTQIAEDAFAECPNLESLDLSACSIEEIPVSMCYKSHKLSKIVMPQGVQRIGPSAFYETALTKVDIPSSVTEIYAYAFERTPLEHIDLTYVENIRDEAFAYCPLSDVIFGNKLEKIRYLAFYKSGLSAVSLSESLEELCGMAFSYCANLKNITCNVMNPNQIKWHSASRIGCYGSEFPFENGITLWVPEGSVELYRQSDYWGQFEDIRPIQSGIKDVHATDDATTEMFDLQGRSVTIPTHGLYIVNGKKTFVE